MLRDNNSSLQKSTQLLSNSFLKFSEIQEIQTQKPESQTPKKKQDGDKIIVNQKLQLLQTLKVDKVLQKKKKTLENNVSQQLIKFNKKDDVINFELQNQSNLIKSKLMQRRNKYLNSQIQSYSRLDVSFKKNWNQHKNRLSGEQSPGGVIQEEVAEGEVEEQLGKKFTLKSSILSVGSEGQEEVGEKAEEVGNVFAEEAENKENEK